MVWYGTVWCMYDNRMIYDMIYGMMWYGMLLYGMACYDMIWHDMVTSTKSTLTLLLYQASTLKVPGSPASTFLNVIPATYLLKNLFALLCSKMNSL